MLLFLLVFIYISMHHRQVFDCCVPNPGFLSLITIDILDYIILCFGWGSGLLIEEGLATVLASAIYSLDASNTTFFILYFSKWKWLWTLGNVFWGEGQNYIRFCEWLKTTAVTLFLINLVISMALLHITWWFLGSHRSHSNRINRAYYVSASTWVLILILFTVWYWIPLTLHGAQNVNPWIKFLSSKCNPWITDL